MPPQDVISDVLLADVNEGREYRGQAPALTKNQLQAQWGTDFVPPAWPPIAPVAPAFVGAAATAGPQALYPAEEDTANLIARQFAELTNPATAPPGSAALTWRFDKLLGAGTFGHVGLWTYTGPAATKPRRTNVAVKEMKKNEPSPALMDLANEQQHMLALASSRAEHVAQIACPATPLTAAQATAEGLLPAKWAGITRRLFMEYFPQGTIESLLEKRDTEQTRVSELTLWLIFNCLLDSICPLQFNATELIVDEVNGTAASPSSAAGLQTWQPMVHFDIKPANLLVGNRNATHTSTPLIKLGDFGLVEQFDGTDPQADVFLRGFRFMGTPKYFAPEQLSEEWDHSTCSTSAEVGNYDYRVNLWQIANIMWMLAMVDKKPVNIRTPFLPNFTINGAPAVGRTYGLNLEATGYSALLRGTIFQCLHEKRTQRPTLETLKMTIFDAIKDGLERDLPIDAWADFQAPQPATAAMLPAPPPPGPPPPPPPGIAPLGFMFLPIMSNVRMIRTRCTATLASGPNRNTQCPNHTNTATLLEWYTGIARCGRHT